MSESRTRGPIDNDSGGGRFDRQHDAESSLHAQPAATTRNVSQPATATSASGMRDAEHAQETYGSARAESAKATWNALGRPWRALRRFFWMDARLAAAKKDGFGPGLPGWNEFDFGFAAAQSADRLSESRDLEAARLLLYRSAVALLTRAHLVRAGFTSSEAGVTAERRGRPADLLDELQPGAVSSPNPAADALHDSPLEEPEGAFELGCQAVRAAEKLRESGGPERSALLLYRAAAVLFLRAHRAEPGGGIRPPTLSDQDWDRLVQLSGAARAIDSLAPDQRRLVTACLGPAGDRHVSALSPNQRRIAVRLLGRLTRELAIPLRNKAKSARRVIRSRWLRIGASAAVVATLLTYGVIRGGWFQRQNLALHRPVAMSSVFSADIGRNPSLVVDGDTTNLGFHTAHGVQQHVTIDLVAPHQIDTVVVYNRVDCCEDRAVPLHLEVSRDGSAFQRVATRTTTFNKWKAKFPPVNARYVRLLRPKQDYFHLAEVEVY